MKKTLALILSVLALLIPVSALELDVAEAADVSVADEAVLAALPETTDATYGDLIYFSDYDENVNWVNKEVVGENATASYTLGYDADKAWSSNKVDDPVNSGRGKVEKLTNGSKYPYYNGIYPTFKNFDLENAMLTVVWDVYVPETTTGTDPRFYFQTAAGFKKVTSASYDFEAGGWQTIVMPWPDSLITFAASQNMNTMFGFAEAGCTYYVDNFRVYAKKPAYASKPAEVDLSKGFLVYFENGNDADTYSNINGSSIGDKNVYATDGYYTKDIADKAAVQNAATFGIGFGTDDDATTFAYADGTDMDGNITVVFEMFNVNTSDLSFYHYIRGPKVTNNWCNGYTSWAGAKAVANKWTTIATSGNTEYSFIGRARTAESGAGDLRMRSMYVYYMPAKHVIIKDVNGSTLVDLTGLETYTLGTSANENGWMIEGASTKFADGATVSVADITGKTIVFNPTYAKKPAEYVDGMGYLVFFDNGNTADAYNNSNMVLVGQSGATVANGYHTRGIWNCGAYSADNPTGLGTLDNTHGIGVRTPDGSAFKYADGSDMEGTITVLFEMYNGTSTDKGFYSWADYNLGGWASWADGYTAWGSGLINNPAKAGQWTNIGVKIHTSKGMIAIARGAWDSHGTALDVRSAYAYYLPSKTVTIDGTFIDLAGKSEYTLPTGEAFNYYKDESGNYYEAGKSYDVASINGKKLTSAKINYATKPADVNLGRGILVYFDNGNEADFYSNINANLVGFAKTTDVDGYFTRDLSGNASAGITGTKGVGLDTGDTETKLAYADGTDMNGAIYLVVDMYNNSDSNNVFYRAVRTNSWDLWQGIYTDWRKYTANSKQWTNIAEAFNSELSFIGFADTDNGNWQGSTFRSVYAYYMPNTRITLNDKVNPQIIDLTNKTEYTFPAISDGNTVWVGQDGSYYFPGDVAAVSDINGVTFDTANFNGYAPETESGVEMRVTSDTSSNGIRFKASIAPSKKAEADEIGFIVARGDVLETLGAELTFDLTADGVDNAEGKLFVKGVAYDKASEKDVVYDTNEDGTEVFTGVCVGIDVTNKAQVNTVLVARPYLKMTVNEKQIAVYGAANSASLAGVANDIKTAAEAGDEAALEAYNGAKEYIDGVISVGAGK